MSTRTKRTKLVFLFLEQLETRAVLSASVLDSVVVHSLAQGAPLGDVAPLAASANRVYSPAQVRHAYGFDRLRYDGAGQTIAIVDAYDSPTVYSDLHYFDSVFGLPDPPSFIKATPQGKPPTNAGWAGEIALDVQWAHAIAPAAKILLVEAKSNGGNDLLAAVDYARRQPGVVVVSMSWGSSEFTNEPALGGYFTTPNGHIGGAGRAGGVTFVASSGDSGARYGPEWPSVSPNVLAVGGTSLYLDASNGYASEYGWSGSGGGVSSYEARPVFQRNLVGGASRATPDVAYNADPHTGFYVYNTTPSAGGYTGWFSFGGTSAGAPQWAALLALADQGRAQSGRGSLANGQTLVYSLPAADFHDVTGGSNGYAAAPGYDLVTGRGSPIANRIIADLIAASVGVVSTHSYSASVTGSTAGHATSDPIDATATAAGTGTATTIPHAEAWVNWQETAFAACPIPSPPTRPSCADAVWQHFSCQSGFIAWNLDVVNSIPLSRNATLDGFHGHVSTASGTVEDGDLAPSPDTLLNDAEP